MHFDARAAKQLKPGEHIIVDGCPGLRLEASATRRSWTYRYRSPVDGNMRQVGIGRWPAMSPAAAAGEWEKLRAARDGGEDPALRRRAARAAGASPVTGQEDAYLVRDLVADYLEGHIDVSRKPKGRAETRRLMVAMTEPIAELEAEAVTRRIAFDLLQATADKPVVTKQLRGELGAAWDYALDAGRLPENTPNWWRLIMRGRLRSKGKKIAGEHIGTTKRALTPVEIGKLINWLPNFSRLVDDVLTIYLWTDTRGSEIVAIEKGEIADERDGLWWTIPKSKTKNARIENATDLRVPLVGRAELVVRRRLAETDRWLFPATGVGGHVAQKTVQTAVYFHQPYSRTRSDHPRPRLTVTHWSPHDLRRSTRTLLASMGCPAEVAEVVMGHMLPGVEGVYNVHRYDAERRGWLTKLSAKLEKLAKEQSRG